MANNRLWIINRHTGERLLMAKYYPSTGWYVYHQDFSDKLNAMLSAPVAGPLMYGGCPIMLEYEMDEADQLRTVGGYGQHSVSNSS